MNNKKKFMQLAINNSKLSCDPNTKVGCVIIKDNVILSNGYNTLPTGLNINNYPLDTREGAFLETKYPYILHSEAKAIIEAKCDLNNSEMYVTLFPCNECAKLIIQAGIKKIYYLEDKYNGTDINIASKKMLDEAKISYELLEMD
jgi:dCMP deaminase